MSWLDLLVIGVYLTIVTAVGSISGKGQRTGVAYFLADRSIHWLPAGITMTAVSISAITFIGMPGQAFKSDWRFLQIYLIIPFASWLGCKLFLPHFNRMQVVTAYEYLETRFDRSTRLWSSALFQVILSGSTGVVIYAPAIMLAEMTGYSVAASVLIVGTVTMIYTIAGGVKGVIYTDLLQASLFVTGWAVVAGNLVQRLPGGLGQAWQIAAADGKLRLIDLSLDPRVPATLWAGAVAMLFTHLALLGANHTQVQKFLTVSSMAGGQRAILFHGFSQLAIYVAFFSLGTLLYAFYRAGMGSLPPGIVPDRVLPNFIMRELPSGVRGLIVVAIFAAAMSTISSALNSLASTTMVDFFVSRSGNEIRDARIATAVWGVVIMGGGILAWRLGSILELIVKVNSYFYGCLLGVFLLGMLTHRANAVGARYGLLAGMLAVLVCSLLQPALWIWFGAVGCLTCMAAGYCLSPGKAHELRHGAAQRARD